MAQVILHPAVLMGPGEATRTTRSGQDPAATARGILLALALSCIAWVGLALLVPRLW